ncbi:hypothetical protein B0O99DRAFT_198476 [Bisporella sp. PMI_857]|nr:hypothetical protein B0O99DRAFT_198476 [Bisporella sp. PMI_857]
MNLLFVSANSMIEIHLSKAPPYKWKLILLIYFGKGNIHVKLNLASPEEGSQLEDRLKPTPSSRQERLRDSTLQKNDSALSLTSFPGGGSSPSAEVGTCGLDAYGDISECIAIRSP